MIKAFDSIRRWLIRKLGGFVCEPPQYGGTVIHTQTRAAVSLTATMAIDPLMNRELQTERITCKLARKLLDEGLVSFKFEQRDQSFFTVIRATVLVVPPEESEVIEEMKRSIAVDMQLPPEVMFGGRNA